VQVGNNGITGDTDLSISGAITSTGGMNKTDLGILELRGATANTIAGNFQISDGTVLLNKDFDNIGNGIDATGTGSIIVGNAVGAVNTANLKLLASNQINNSSTVTVLSDGNFNVNGMTETIAAFAGAGTIDTGAGGLLIAGGTNASFTFSGDLEGNGSIQKVGTGTLTFDQSINFSTGTLELNGGTLALAGNGNTFTVGTLRITGNTFLDFGMSSATTLNATNVIIDEGATLTITNWVHLQDYFFAQAFSQYGGPAASTDVRGVQPQNQIVFTSWSANSTVWQSWDKQITPAPEPATYGAMLMGSVLGLLGFRRWKKKNAAKE
jgi:autotransporter-associated beta strand protein